LPSPSRAAAAAPPRSALATPPTRTSASDGGQVDEDTAAVLAQGVARRSRVFTTPRRHGDVETQRFSRLPCCCPWMRHHPVPPRMRAGRRSWWSACLRTKSGARNSQLAPAPTASHPTLRSPQPARLRNTAEVGEGAASRGEPEPRQLQNPVSGRGGHRGPCPCWRI
jgi:hypothetical protein